MDGILMIAAQALERRSADHKKEIASLRAENTALKARLEALIPGDKRRVTDIV